MTAIAEVEALWTALGLPREKLVWLSLAEEGPVLPSSFQVDLLAQASIAASALAAAVFWERRGGTPQEVTVSRAAAAAEFRSERLLRVDGDAAPALWDPVAGVYRCGGGRWIRIHTNFPHHRDGMLRLLGCDYDRQAVAAAIAGWSAPALEAAVADAGLVAAMVRTPEEWAAHPQSQALLQVPLISLEKIGEAPPKSWAAAKRPLEGLKVLDLTRIIAGPVAGRALASHGATVLRVAARHLPFVAPLVIDTGRGKLSTFLDLREAAGRSGLDALAAGADIFLQSYRPDSLAARGFGPEALAARHPGIVYGALSAYGPDGPWAERRGFDSLVQAATGFNHAEAEAFESESPRALPCQALDHGSGFLLALGCLAAILRQREEGGSWLVQVSLARSGAWLKSLGRVAADLQPSESGAAEVAPFLETRESGFGPLTAVRPAARLSETPARWERPSMPLGSHKPHWPS